jgi:hypothetical protein
MGLGVIVIAVLGWFLQILSPKDCFVPFLVGGTLLRTGQKIISDAAKPLEALAIDDADKRNSTLSELALLISARTPVKRALSRLFKNPNIPGR